MLNFKSKGKAKRGIVAILDVGSSMVRCAIAQLTLEGPLEILGYGQAASAGINCGAVVDMEEAEASIANAVHQAEKSLGITIKDVYLGINGNYLSSNCYKGSISIENHAVDETDIRNVFQKTCAQVMTDPSKQVIHVIPLAYSIDQAKGIKDPRGMFGDELGAFIHIVTAKVGPLQNLVTCVSRCHLQVAGMIAVPYATGLGCLVEDEKELGVTVINLGGASTSFSVFNKGQMVYMGCVPIGGRHVTSDIARGLSTPMDHAERLKNMYGTALVSSAEARELMTVPQMGESRSDGTNQMSRMALVSIIKPRLEEIFEAVRKNLEAAHMDICAGKRVVLTGSASQIAGIRELASFVLDKNVRLGKPVNIVPDETTSDPSFTTCAGMLEFVREDSMDAQATAGSSKQSYGLTKITSAIKNIW